MADAESSNKGDVEPKGGLFQAVLEHWQVLVKIVELVSGKVGFFLKQQKMMSPFQILCAICVGIIYEPLNSLGVGKSRLHHVGVMFTAYTGYIVINTVLLIGRALKDTIPYKTSTIFSMCGAILHLVAVCLLANDRSNYTREKAATPARLEAMLVSIVIAAINALVFAMEGVFTFIRREDF